MFMHYSEICPVNNYNLYFHLDSLIVCHLPHGPTARFGILNAVLRHDIPDIGSMPQAYPHLAFYNFKTKLGNRVSFSVKILLEVSFILQF